MPATSLGPYRGVSVSYFLLLLAKCQQLNISTKRLFKGVSNVKSSATALFQVKCTTRSRVRLFMAGKNRTRP